MQRSFPTHCGPVGVSKPDGMRPAAFLSCPSDEDDPMDIEHLDYAQLSEDAMIAADGAATVDECQAHLARAVRYASLACIENHRSPDFNIVELRPGIRRQF
jgi:hypothetical protein